MVFELAAVTAQGGGAGGLKSREVRGHRETKWP